MSDNLPKQADLPKHAEATPDAGAREYVDKVVVSRPRRELFAFWRDFSNLPTFMQNVVQVTTVDSLSSVWTVRDGSGRTAEWQFLVTDEEEDRMIAWATSGPTPVRYSGRVEFRDTESAGDTQVVATLRHDPAEGLVDNLLAKVSGGPVGEPLVQTRDDLARFKEWMEHGAH